MMRVLMLLLLSALPLMAGWIEGVVTDGREGLPGVRVYPDRGRRMGCVAPPVTETDGEGRFRLEIQDSDQVLTLEKEGWRRDLVQRLRWGKPLRMRPASGFRRESVLLVRLGFPGRPPLRPDGQLRRLLFGREPGASTAANYLYEVSKGDLLLEEGRILHLDDPSLPEPVDQDRNDLIHHVLERLEVMDLSPFDRVDNRTGAARPDGKPDHLWILAPGPPRSVTLEPAHLTAVCLLSRLPWDPDRVWPVVFATEEVPLGTLLHESFHAMGEHRVDDLYLDCDHPATAGAWCLMDAGQWKGWDAVHPGSGPWQSDTAYSPSQPLGWVRSELWYHGRFRDTVASETMRGAAWTGWIDPLEYAPGDRPQRLVVPDPRGRGRFWELSVRRPVGFDAGRVGDRWGPGFEGLTVARVDPSRLTYSGDPLGPVRLLDAHPGTPEPAPPRYPCGRWELDDAAFGLGPGEVAAGNDGPLHWEVLEAEPWGGMRVRVSLGGRGKPGGTRTARPKKP